MRRAEILVTLYMTIVTIKDNILVNDETNEIDKVIFSTFVILISNLYA